MSSKMTFSELEAATFFFREFDDDRMTLEDVLDAHAMKDPRVQTWRIFESLHPEDMNSAVNDLLYLIRRLKSASTL